MKIKTQFKLTEDKMKKFLTIKNNNLSKSKFNQKYIKIK